MAEEKSRDRKIKEIRKLYRQKLGRKKGKIIDYAFDYELEVESIKYLVLGRDGIYCGYYLPPFPSYADRTIMSQIASSQECHTWESLEETELDNWLDFLKNYQPDNQSRN